jgi:hypothetical protein
MDARHKKPGHLEQADGPFADERNVEVARPPTCRIERRVIVPAMSRDGAAPQHNRCAGRDRLLDLVAERSKQLGPAVKRESENVGALFVFGRSVLFAQLRPPLRMGS